jgi:hypothetical protein
MHQTDHRKGGRNMIHRLFTIAWPLSLLLCSLAIGLWLRSYWVADTWTVQRIHYQKTVGDDPNDELYLGQIAQDFVQSNQGSISIFLRRSADDLTLAPLNVKEWSQDYPEGNVLLWDRDTPSWPRRHFEVFQVNESHVLFHHLGFFVGWCNIGGISSQFTQFTLKELEVPTWFIAALAFLLPGRRALRWIGLRRRKIRGRCVSCGYDLRASKDRCPECGTATNVGNTPDSRGPSFSL